MVVLQNTRMGTFCYPTNLAIAQLVIKQHDQPMFKPAHYDEFIRYKEKRQSERGSKGFGSTNKPSFLETLKNAVEGKDEEDR